MHKSSRRYCCGDFSLTTFAATNHRPSSNHNLRSLPWIMQVFCGSCDLVITTREMVAIRSAGWYNDCVKYFLEVLSWTFGAECYQVLRIRFYLRIWTMTHSFCKWILHHKGGGCPVWRCDGRLCRRRGGRHPCRVEESPPQGVYRSVWGNRQELWRKHEVRLRVFWCGLPGRWAVR